ncbi:MULTISPECIES: ATP-binding protein [unclassified Meridianimarinicoccus]|uniref:ATP-binding protein n=1 Tax=unclassified Meridianimarinicoccus TaxID=2923344 RepID=UPI0018676F33|nr:ATP-binding protein [Fluviibacterium sp. MJW13]
MPVVLVEQRLEASFESVSAALTDLECQLLTALPAPDTMGSLLLVLGEALNNVVEHAYRGVPGGHIDLRLTLTTGGLCIDIRDRGHPILGALPEGRNPLQAGAAVEDLPEGGFGWSLIRMLTRDLCYESRDGQNRLTCTIPVDATTPPPGPPCPSHHRA